ncbi:MAG: BTAD domain-containing putative transcriptional regulator [Gammaproteobacteria bacterium]
MSIALLGRFSVTLDGHPVTDFESDRVRALLAYLAVEADRPHTREALAALLWPEQDAEAARANLRHILLKLRRAIGDERASPPHLLTSRQTLQFNLASDHTLDVTTLNTLLAACESHPAPDACAACVDHLSQAVHLYQGSFLAGLSLPTSMAFEEWARIRQEQLHRQTLEALYRLAGFHEDNANYAEAQRYAWRQVQLEPGAKKPTAN